MHVIELVAFISEVMVNFVTDALKRMAMRYLFMTTQLSKKRKNYRRIVVGSEHWQWIYGKRSVVAYNDETGEKRLADKNDFFVLGSVETPLGMSFYSYVSPRLVAAWLAS